MDERLYFLIEYHLGHTPLEEVFCKHYEMHQRPHQYDIPTLTGADAVAWAAAEVNAGQTSDALLRLASMPEQMTWRDVVELFRAAYADLGYDRLTREQHLRGHRREIARQMLAGTISPQEGCRHMWRIVGHLDFPGDTDMYECDMLLAGCDPLSGEALEDARLEAEIMEYAHAIVDEPLES